MTKSDDQTEIPQDKLRQRVEEKIDRQLKETFPASDTPNYEAIEHEAKEEIQAELNQLNKNKDRTRALNH